MIRGIILLIGLSSFFYGCIPTLSKTNQMSTRSKNQDTLVQPTVAELVDVPLVLEPETAFPASIRPGSFQASYRVRNPSSTETVQVTGVIVGAPFVLDQRCAIRLTPGASCTFPVLLSSGQSGKVTGVLRVFNQNNSQTQLSLQTQISAFAMTLSNSGQFGARLPSDPIVNASIGINADSSSGSYKIEICKTNLSQCGNTITASIPFYFNNDPNLKQLTALSGSRTVTIHFKPSAMHASEMIDSATGQFQYVVRLVPTNTALTSITQTISGQLYFQLSDSITLNRSDYIHSPALVADGGVMNLNPGPIEITNTSGGSLSNVKCEMLVDSSDNIKWIELSSECHNTLTDRQTLTPSFKVTRLSKEFLTHLRSNRIRKEAINQRFVFSAVRSDGQYISRSIPMQMPLQYKLSLEIKAEPDCDQGVVREVLKGNNLSSASASDGFSFGESVFLKLKDGRDSSVRNVRGCIADVIDRTANDVRLIDSQSISTNDWGRLIESFNHPQWIDYEGAPKALQLRIRRDPILKGIEWCEDMMDQNQDLNFFSCVSNSNGAANSVGTFFLPQLPCKGEDGRKDVNKVCSIPSNKLGIQVVFYKDNTEKGKRFSHAGAAVGSELAFTAGSFRTGLPTRLLNQELDEIEIKIDSKVVKDGNKIFPLSFRLPLLVNLLFSSSASFRMLGSIPLFSDFSLDPNRVNQLSQLTVQPSDYFLETVNGNHEFHYRGKFNSNGSAVVLRGVDYHRYSSQGVIHQSRSRPEIYEQHVQFEDIGAGVSFSAFASYAVVCKPFGNDPSLWAFSQYIHADRCEEYWGGRNNNSSLVNANKGNGGAFLYLSPFTSFYFEKTFDSGWTCTERTAWGKVSNFATARTYRHLADDSEGGCNDQKVSMMHWETLGSNRRGGVPNEFKRIRFYPLKPIDWDIQKSGGKDGD